MDLHSFCHIEAICNTTIETDRLVTLKRITDHYGIVPTCATYGESARAHPYFNRFHYRCRLNARSLAINHITILEKYRNSTKPLLIFESDVLAIQDLDTTDRTLKQVLKDMTAQSIDFVFLGKGCFPSVDTSQRRHIVNDLYHSATSRCTESYLISPKGIRAYLDYFYTTLGHIEIDADYNVFFNARQDIKCCWAIPELFKQGSLEGMYTSLVPK